MSEEAAELNKAEDDLAEVSNKIQATEGEIAKYEEMLHDSEARVADTQKTKLPAVQGETIHAEEQVKAAEEDLHEAEESFNQEEFDAAVEEEKQVEKEIVEAKEEAEAAGDTTEAKAAD